MESQRFSSDPSIADPAVLTRPDHHIGIAITRQQGLLDFLFDCRNCVGNGAQGNRTGVNGNDRAPGSGSKPDKNLIGLIFDQPQVNTVTVIIFTRRSNNSLNDFPVDL